MTVSVTNPSELVLMGTIERIKILVTDDNNEPVDATALSLQVYDQGQNLIIMDDFFHGYGQNPTQPPTLPTQIVRTGVGSYYFPFGDTTFDPNNSSALPQELSFVWSVTSGSEPEDPSFHVVKVVSIRTMRLVPKLRLIVDKCVKTVDDNPDDPVFVGYTTSMLVQFLEGGLGWINAFQPYPVWSSVDDFPDLHLRILIDAAVCDALTSQELFAVDTDVNYSDQGNVFTIDHQPKLSAILNSTWQRLTQLVPPMKKQYLQNGAVHMVAGPGFRFQTLLDAAPNGSLFRNAFLGGSGGTL